MKPTPRSVVVALVLAVAASACRTSAPPSDAPALPFHVALVPLRSVVLRDAGPAGEDGLRLEPDPARLTRAVHEALAARSFTRVTLLEDAPPAPGGAPGARERELVERARAVGADLVLELELDLVPLVRHRASGSAWLDIPLFLLGGPFVWFVEDRTYTADVELRGAFYDRWILDGGDRLLGDRFARLFEASASFEGVDVDFFRRTDNLGLYAASIVVPSYFLARESDHVAERLSELVCDRLAASFAAGVLRRGDELVRSDLTASFHLVPEKTALERDREGLVLNATVLQRVDDRNELSAWRVSTSSGAAEGTFAARPPDPHGERWLEWTFLHRLPDLPLDETIGLEIEAGSRDTVTRSYTLRVPGAVP
jgi:hypothetical protein